MRRIALLLFGLVLTVGVIGCKKEEPAAPPAENTESAPAEGAESGETP